MVTHNCGSDCKRKRYKWPGTAYKAQKNFTEDSDKVPVVFLYLQNNKTAANV